MSASRKQPLLLLCFLALCMSASAADWYVAPDGKKDAAGTKEAPWDLRTVLRGGRKAVKPGDTVWLKAGAYQDTNPRDKGRFQCYLNGEEGNPIVVRGAPGERAIVQNGIMVSGVWVTMRDFEMTYPDYDRRTQRPGLWFHKRGGSAVNMVIHDVGHPGIGWWVDVGGGVDLYGNLLWANGFYQGRWKRGSGFYMQNKDGTRLVANNICFRNFTTGFKAYTEKGYAHGFEYRNNIVFDTSDRGIFASDDNEGLRRFKVINNCIWQRLDDPSPFRALDIGWEAPNNDGVVTGNYIVGAPKGGALIAKGWKNLSFTGNTVIGPVKWVDMPDLSKGNTMLAGRPTTGVRTFVFPNKYEPGRAHVAVFNWEKKSAVAVDLSKVLKAGAKYEIRDAQNFFGKPVVTGTYDGKPVSIPMNQTEVARPVGPVPHIEKRFRPTAPEFGAFVVRKKP